MVQEPASVHSLLAAHRLNDYGAFGDLILAFLSFGALAAEADYTTLTGSVSFVNVIAAILAIGVILMAVYVVWKGVKMVIGMLRGG